MKNIFSLIFLISMAILQWGCTKSFKDLNTDPYALTQAQLKANNANVSAYFTTAQQNLVENGPWLTQLDNFYGDNFIGYVYPPSSFRGNQYPCTFFNQDGWQDGLWGNAYDNVMRQTHLIINNARAVTPATDATNTQIYIAKIIRVAGMHLVADGWGPIIYSKYAQPNADLSYTYDSQKDAYTAFFADLDTAVTGLTALEGGTSTFGNLDIIYSGHLNQWIKAANSIRLRLGLRLTRIDPTTAKAQVQKALSHPDGVITENVDNMHVYFNSQLGGGFVQVSRDWTDERLGADFQTILTGYKDPRLRLFFSPVTDSSVGNVDSTMLGIREGADIAAKGDYVGYSPVNVAVFGQNPSAWTGDLNVITAPEVNEALAEVALRGWLAGSYNKTPKQYYEAGIKAHFDMYGISTAEYNAYIAGTTLPVSYKDPKKSAHNIDSVNRVYVKFDSAGTNEHQLQQIMTQKWIALFPNGKEAWSEWRRTGYPKVFPNYLNYSGGTISTADGARRIFKFALGEYQNNANGVKGATTALGGADVGGTHVWWDPAGNTSNF